MKNSIVKNVSQLIGQTPIMELSNYKNKYNLDVTLLVKLELFNPAGSIKDRLALAMIEKAEKSGVLTKDSVIIEPTSGNTGIGVASIAASKGYKVILTMPETMSVERRNLLKAYGAELVLTEGAKGVSGAVEKAEEIASNTPNAFMPKQFENEVNPLVHYETTGPEIWEQTGGNIDIFVAGIGTGGTISGVGKYLKEKNPNIKIIAVEPASSPLLSKGQSGPHKIQGIGANFIPKTLDTEIFDEIICVENDDAINTAKEIPQTDGVLVGISSGASLFASKIVGSREENKGKTIVALFPDTGERYLSMF